MSMLKEKSGKVSQARVTVLLCTITGCAISILGVWKGVDLVGLGVLVGLLIGVPVAGKTAQKGNE